MLRPFIFNKPSPEFLWDLGAEQEALRPSDLQTFAVKRVREEAEQFTNNPLQLVFRSLESECV